MENPIVEVNNEDGYFKKKICAIDFIFVNIVNIMKYTFTCIVFNFRK